MKTQNKMLNTLILDVDGVLTDGIKYYDPSGHVALKTICDKDWTAIKRFRAIGINVVFITGDSYDEGILKNRNLPVIVNRGAGFHNDKINFLPQILDLYQCTADEVAYIGDDIFDIGLLGAVRYAYCVADAPLMVQEFADVLACKGGENVIMKFFEEVEHQGIIPKVSYADIIDKIYELDIKETF